MPDGALQVVRSQVGPVLESHPIPSRHGQTEVWRAHSRDSVCYVKRHRHGEPFRREVDAYRTWLAPVGGVATLLGADDAQRWLVLSALPGRRPDRVSPEDAARAGRWLRRLHQLPFEDPDPLPPSEALARRVDAAAGRAAGLVDAATADAAVALARQACAAVVGMRRVRCHLDFTPENWLLGDDLGVVDFERARPDVPQADLARLAATSWLDRPDLMEALAVGYGDAALSHDQTVSALAALDALATVVWAHRHGAAALETRARAALHQIVSR